MYREVWVFLSANSILQEILQKRSKSLTRTNYQFIFENQNCRKRSLILSLMLNKYVSTF